MLFHLSVLYEGGRGWTTKFVWGFLLGKECSDSKKKKLGVLKIANSGILKPSTIYKSDDF